LPILLCGKWIYSRQKAQGVNFVFFVFHLFLSPFT
jgi:hypothetical protein